jgi:predicted metal-binding protein
MYKMGMRQKGSRRGGAGLKALSGHKRWDLLNKFNQNCQQSAPAATTPVRPVNCLANVAGALVPITLPKIFGVLI